MSLDLVDELEELRQLWAVLRAQALHPAARRARPLALALAQRCWRAGGLRWGRNAARRKPTAHRRISRT